MVLAIHNLWIFTMICNVWWFFIIQGPPGTGKSFVGVALVHLLLSMNVPLNYGPILVRDTYDCRCSV